MTNLKIHRDADLLAADVARQMAEAARRAVDQRGRFGLVLCGGSTPRPLYGLLAKPDPQWALPWEHTHVFWSDERCLPPDHPESNYRDARRLMLERVPIPPANVHRIMGETPDPLQAARAYEQEVADFVKSDDASFDLVLLGMGADGHTASLFPGSPALATRGRLAVAVEPGPQARPPVQRITLTLEAINQARQVHILVTGRSKALTAGRVLASHEASARDYPVARVRPTGELWWHLDSEAAGRLPTLIAESLRPLP